MHNERKRLMALNSRFLQASLGHLWSVLSFPTILFPSWSSLWLSAQLEPTLAMLSVNSFLSIVQRIQIILHHPMTQAFLGFVQCASWLQTKQNRGLLLDKSCSYLMLPQMCSVMMTRYESGPFHWCISGAAESIKCHFYSRSVSFAGQR